MSEPLREAIRELSLAERLTLLTELWDDIAASTEEVPLTEAQREDLERRLTEYETDPDSGSPWDEVRSRISER